MRSSEELGIGFALELVDIDLVQSCNFIVTKEVIFLSLCVWFLARLMLVSEFLLDW